MRILEYKATKAFARWVNANARMLKVSGVAFLMIPSDRWTNT